ncbi:hypothetical protein BBJ28_00009741 [Nothophytophthora sp. Chile5]|nr:hypothetical protein BBJ28_00009741 [Nothophytophthora sp. Chile5]
MIPPRASAKYAYDGSKIAALKKKAPVSKLLPTNASESQLEKELNQAFAQVTTTGGEGDVLLLGSYSDGLAAVFPLRKWASATCSFESSSYTVRSSKRRILRLLQSPEMKPTDRPERQKKRRIPRFRFRPRAQQLRLEDFDDVRYTMESVRLGDDASGDAAVDRLALLESLFLALLGVLLLGGCVAVGFATHLLEYSKEALRWLLPMLLLPLAWVAALHLWERRVLAQQSKIATF